MKGLKAFKPSKKGNLGSIFQAYNRGQDATKIFKPKEGKDGKRNNNR